jgi:hypothetical protein
VADAGRIDRAGVCEGDGVTCCELKGKRAKISALPILNVSECLIAKYSPILSNDWRRGDGPPTGYEGLLTDGNYGLLVHPKVALAGTTAVWVMHG